MTTRIITSLLAISMIAVNSPAAFGMEINAADASVRIMGRTAEKDGSVTMAFPGVEMEVKFTGSASVSMRGEVLNNHGWYNYYVDGATQPFLEIITGKFNVKLADNLDPKAVHTIRIVRRSESWEGVVRVDGFSLDDGAKILSPDPLPARKILAIGDSITCGYNIEYTDPKRPGDCNSNAELTYEWDLARRFNAQVEIVAYGGKGLVRDWRGMNTQMLKDAAAEGTFSNPREIVTAPDFFERALPDDPSSVWDHSKYQPDLVVICIGQNDFSQVSLPVSEYVPEYVKFVDRIHSVYPAAKILVLSSPMAEKMRDDGWQPRGIALERAIVLLDQHYIRLGDPIVMPLFLGQHLGPLDAHPTSAEHKLIANEMEPIVEFLTGWK